jgi:secreted trypsin-like serine protease
MIMSSIMLTKTSFILGASLLSTSVLAVVAEPKVIHGIPATATQVPWQVALYVENEQGETAHFCSGSLIAAKWVLTAAHCLEPFKDENQQLVKVKRYIAVVGEVDLTQVIRSDSAQIIDVKRNIVYSEYQSDLNLDNDIALLELETAVDLKRCGANCAVIPWLGASNAAQYSFHGSPAQVAGWGQMLSDSQKGEQDLYPSVLQVGQLTVTNCPVVNYTYNGKSWPISANMMCAVGRGP